MMRATVGMLVIIVAASVFVVPLGCQRVVPGVGGGEPNEATTEPAMLVDSLLDDPNVPAASMFAGDGIAAKRALMPTLFPGLQELISGGSEAAEAMLAKFETTPSFDQDDNLFLLAYALEQMDYTAGLGRLVAFLEGNITGEVPASLAAVTHAVRRMIGLPLNDSAAYLASEIEETIELAGEELASGSRVNPETLRTSCWRQFVLVDADDHPLVYPPGHPKAGQIITVGGTIYPADTTIPDSEAADQRKRVDRGGGTYVDFTDPDSGVTFEGEPTRTFNCAGFAFRSFNDGMKWNGDPGEWFDALQAAGAIERVTNDGDAAAGNFVFYYGEADPPAHVAVVQSNTLFGGITVINADRWSGLFTADIDATYFFGASTFSQDFLNGLETRYQRREIWRWKYENWPLFRPYTNRSQANSCHGEDEDGDGFPEWAVCNADMGRCIDPEFTSGESDPNEGTATPGYRVYLLAQIGRGQLEVLQEGSEDEEIPLCGFAGGGLDCTVMTTLEPITEAFPTAEQAVTSLCGRVTNLAILPLGVGPAGDLDGTSRFLSGEVYNLLYSCND